MASEKLRVRGKKRKKERNNVRWERGKGAKEKNLKKDAFSKIYNKNLI
ncbi:MAG: hypothetical protein KGY74_07045 [Candidatus Cloacimonetes bacterium]|nr:hypothetical protein [Candidatus Cloacimonadota bacterium]